jgi:F-type H+-transporting ATPase subunit delta
VKRGDAIARRYARALFQLGEERGDVSALLAELEQLNDTIVESPELVRVLFTPIHPRAERAAVIRELVRRLELSDDVRGLSLLLVDENRTRHLPHICEALEDMVERAAGRVEAEVTSARELSSDEANALREALSRRLDQQVTLKLEVNPDLIGGVVARVGDLLLDGSVRTQLASLRGGLRKGSA